LDSIKVGKEDQQGIIVLPSLQVPLVVRMIK